MFISPTVISAWEESLLAAPKITPLSQEPVAPVYVKTPMSQLEFETPDVSFISVEPPVS